MRDELTEALYDDFPTLFTDQGRPTLDYGFECGDGWYALIRRLCVRINETIASDPALDPKEFVAIQVKEKFGTLRFYMSRYNDALHQVLFDGTKESSETCEWCGGPGTENQNGGYVRVICDSCEVERVRRMQDQMRRMTRRDSGTGLDY